MYRFLLRPKWLAFHLLCLLTIFGMLAAAKWQWTRYNQRNDFVDLVHQRQDAEPQQLDDVLDTKSPKDIEFLRVTAAGHYVGDTQLEQINQTQDDTVGVDVLTPFQVDGGPIVIVNRGFVPYGADVPAAPTGNLVIGGTARTTQRHQAGELTDNRDGVATEVRNVDLPLISQRLGIDVAPIYVELIASKPPTPVPPTPVPPPDLSGGPPHLSYTVQWCIFSVCVVVGWVLAVRRSARKRAGGPSAGDASAAPTVNEGEHPAVPSA